MPTKYWLMKSEPGTYAIDDLERDGTTFWEGVRNYQARNLMRDDMRVGDQVLFYHSNADPTGVAGLAEVVREAYPDDTALDKKSPYYDPKSSTKNQPWCRVDVGYVTRFPKVVSLAAMREEKKLEGLMVLKKGMRLSIQPVSAAHFARVRAMGLDG